MNMLVNIKSLRKLQVGVVGVGNHMTENLLPAMRLIEGIELNTVCCRTEEKAKKTGSQFGFKHYSVNWEDLFYCQLDAVVVSADPALHVEIILKGLETGVPVFCEKPMAITLTDLNKIKTKLIETKSPEPYVGFNFSHIDYLRNAKQYLKSDIVNLTVHCFSSKPKKLFWNCKSIVESFLFAVAIHPINTVIDYLGESCSVVFCNLTEFNNNQFDLIVCLSSISGKSATLLLSNKSNRFETKFEFTSENGNYLKVIDLNELILVKQEKQIYLDKKESVHFSTPSLQGGFNKTGYQTELIDFFHHSPKCDSNGLERSIDVTCIIRNILKMIGLAYQQIGDID